MAEKFEETAIIIRQEEIADDIYSMWLHTDQIAAHAKAGQFLFIVMMEADCFQDRSVFVRLIKRMAQSVWCIV
jgi:dihydroorotate dehydrogenase electron transfer subunit